MDTLDEIELAEQAEREGMAICGRIRIGKNTKMLCPNCRQEQLPTATQSTKTKDTVTLSCGCNREPETLPLRKGCVSFEAVQYNKKRALELWPLLEQFDGLALSQDQRARDFWG
jgi:hypothetical protein